ncbi:hypothetical protein ABZP36_025049 [Zizania latifolia]
MGEYDGDEAATKAASILLSFWDRRLRRWPEWAPLPDEEPSAEVVVEYHRTLFGWANPWRKRSRQRATPAIWVQAAESLGLSLEHGAGAGSGVASSGEDEAPPPPPTMKVNAMLMTTWRSRSPVDYGAAAGSGPSTSGGDLAQSRLQPPLSEKAHVKTVTAEKDAMAVSSPGTPLDYAVAAGSGASSSGELAQSPRKRKAPGTGGSGGASSGDEGCSSPSKRAHLAAAAAVPAVQADASAAAKDKEVAVKVEVAKDDQVNRDEKGVLKFDLNEDANAWEG